MAQELDRVAAVRISLATGAAHTLPLKEKQIYKGLFAWYPGTLRSIVHMAIRLFFVALCLAPLGAQRSASFQDLAPQLAAKIAAALAPGDQVMLTWAADEGDGAALLPVEAEIRRVLAGRGVRVVESGAATVLRTGCSISLRERACLAEVRRGEARDLIVVTRPLDTGGESAMPLSLELIPVFSQPAPILDAAVAGSRLLVLDSDRIAWYQQEATEGERPGVAADRAISTGRWTLRRAAAITHTRPWPRDVRGRLRADDTDVTAWLPGVTCRGSADLLRLACADERGESWPIGIDNTGIDAARNYFNTPEGLPFFAAAPLDARGRRRRARQLVRRRGSSSAGGVGYRSRHSARGAPCVSRHQPAPDRDDGSGVRRGPHHRLVGRPGRERCHHHCS